MGQKCLAEVIVWPNSPPMRRYDSHPGSALRAALVAQISRFHPGGHCDAGFGHWSKRRGLQRFEWADPATTQHPQAESLFGLSRVNDKFGYESYLNYIDLRDRNRSFEDLAASNIDQAGLDTGDNASRVWLYEASGNYSTY
jgi:hypothetical protein